MNVAAKETTITNSEEYYSSKSAKLKGGPAKIG